MCRSGDHAKNRKLELRKGKKKLKRKKSQKNSQSEGLLKVLNNRSNETKQTSVKCDPKQNEKKTLEFT